MLTFAEILAKFGPGKRTGKEYRVRCPVHGDDAPSLDICEGTSTIALFQCRSAGCHTADILKAVGLEWSDILPGQNGHHKEWDAVHEYRDATGTLRYRVFRRGSGSGKVIRQQAAGGAWSMAGVERIPYRLNELHGHAQVFVVEGEKCADRLWALGLPATCNVGGAKKWRASDAQFVKASGATTVVVIADNDDEGRAHAGICHASCQQAGLEARILDLVGLHPKQDVADWLDAGHTADELVALTHPPDPYPLQFMHAALQTDMSPPRWIVQGLIPAGSLNFLVAKPKVGKTTLARSLALSVAQGREWLGYATHRGEVWYLAFEGRLADHMSHFVQLGAAPDDPLAIQEQRPFPGHLDAMFLKMRERRPSLVVIDHMQLALQLPKMNDVGLVTLALQPFIDFTRETGCAVLFLAHARKGQSGFGADSEDAIDALAGAGAFGGACDTYILLKKSRGTGGAYRTIETVQRVGESLDPTVLEFNRDDGSLRFAGDAHKYREQVMADELVAALVAHGEPLSDAAWLVLIAGHKSTKMAARSILLRSNRVRRVAGTGKKGDPYLYWITPNAVDTAVDIAGDSVIGFGSNSVPLGKTDVMKF